MDVLVVAQRPQDRWTTAAALGLQASAACPPDVAASRLAHPAARLPEAVLLLVQDDADVRWLRRQSGRRGAVPIVAVPASRRFAAAARAAGATAVVEPGAGHRAIARSLRAVTAPATVVDLDAARTA